MDRSNNEEKNNNVILLIVIAIATMVIVVVGATFAYLSDVVENEATANIGGKTEGGSDMFLLDAGDILSLNVTYDNFGINTGDQTDSTVASVSLASGKENITHKYSMYLNVINNDFEYTSGSCYYVSAEAGKVNAQTMEECVSGGNLWARSASEEEYSCYQKDASTAINLDKMNNNEIVCDRYENAIWAKEAIPELVLDLYSLTKDNTEASCIGQDNKGVCLKASGSIENTSENECIDGTWVANVFKAGKCYRFSKRVDITEARADKNNKYEIIKSKEITSSKEADASDYYLATIRMINLDHDQVINKSKLFSGNLVLSIVDEDVKPEQ